MPTSARLPGMRSAPGAPRDDALVPLIAVRALQESNGADNLLAAWSRDFLGETDRINGVLADALT